MMSPAASDWFPPPRSHRVDRCGKSVHLVPRQWRTSATIFLWFDFALRQLDPSLARYEISQIIDDPWAVRGVRQQAGKSGGLITVLAPAWRAGASLS